MSRKKYRARARTRVEKVLDALRYMHPRYRDATPDDICQALIAAGYKPRARPEWSGPANSIRAAEKRLGRKLAKTNQWALFPSA